MADFGVADISGIVGGTAGVGVLAKYVWDSVKGRRDQLEEKAETRTELKIDALAQGQARIELIVRDLSNGHASTAGTLSELKNRINEGLGDHKARINALELWRAGVDAKRRR